MFEPKKKSRSGSSLAASSHDVLLSIPLLDKLDSDELAHFKSYVNYLQVAKGEVVFSEGDDSDYVCFVSAGSLDVLKYERDRPVLLSTLVRGRVIGEMALVDHYPRSATVVAREDSTLVVLPREKFEQIERNHPRMAVKIIREVARLLSLNLRKTSAFVVDMSSKP